MNVLFFKFAAGLYLSGGVSLPRVYLFLKNLLSKMGTAIVGSGFIVPHVGLVDRYIEAGHTPVANNLYESLSFFALDGHRGAVDRADEVSHQSACAFLSPIALIPDCSLPLRCRKRLFLSLRSCRASGHPFHVFRFLGKRDFRPGVLLCRHVPRSGAPIEIEEDRRHCPEAAVVNGSR